MSSTNPGAAVTTTNNVQVTFSNAQQIAVLSVSLAPASVAANTSAEQTFTVTGLQTTDMVVVSKPTAQAGLAVGNARVSAANTLAITYINDTAGGLTPTTESYQVLVVRPASNLALPSTMPLL